MKKFTSWFNTWLHLSVHRLLILLQILYILEFDWERKLNMKLIWRNLKQILCWENKISLLNIVVPSRVLHTTLQKFAGRSLYNVDSIQIRIASLKSVNFLELGKIKSKSIGASLHIPHFRGKSLSEMWEIGLLQIKFSFIYLKNTHFQEFRRSIIF